MSWPWESSPAQPTYNPVAGWDPYPETEAGWRELYTLRWQSYLHHPYGAQFQKSEHLFRAFDDSGNEIDQTRRVFRWYQFITDTDCRALAPGQLVLETQPGTPMARLVQGERIWQRSRLQPHLQRRFTSVCALGDMWLEAVRTSGRPPYRAKLVWYDPRQVTAWYDAETGTELEKVEIELCYLQNPQQVAMSETLHSYKRVLTKTHIEVYRNGELQPQESGEHGLGAVPCVHLQAQPFDQPEHGLPAAAGVERLLAKMDSLATQISAIGTRYANPTLALFGFKVGAGTEVQRFGRMIDGAPTDGRAEFIEAKSASVPGLLEAMRELDKHLRDTSPEVLFASDAAQESAEARSLRGNAFELKMLTMRAGIYSGLTEATAYAVALEGNRPYDPEHDEVFRIDAPPVLPRNQKLELEILEMLKPSLKRADYTRHLQRLGYVPKEADPEAYATEVAAEQTASGPAEDEPTDEVE